MTENRQEREQRLEEETKSYLAKIRKTVNDSRALIAQAELRMAETDRFLESQGLTREQVSAMTFSAEQRQTVNAELKRRGLPELPEDEPPAGGGRQEDDVQVGGGRPAEPNFIAGDQDGDLENRKRRFNVMMRQYRL